MPKVYPQQIRRHEKGRRRKEISKLFGEGKIKNRPIVIDYNEDQNWLMTNWIQGESQKSWPGGRRFIEFIKAINKTSMKNERERLSNRIRGVTIKKELIGQRQE